MTYFFNILSEKVRETEREREQSLENLVYKKDRSAHGSVKVSAERITNAKLGTGTEWN